MRVAIAGAGNVGRSIARELLANDHQVLLIDRDPDAIRPDSVPGAEWLLADACEIDSLEDARIDRCDVAIAATGDDKANLVHSLLAKTEFAVPRTVARVNHPSNEWMFDEVWGVDVAVSTPRLMCALVEEAVTVGDLVRLFAFRGGRTNLVEMTLPTDSPTIGHALAELTFPGDAVLVALIRDGKAHPPRQDAALEGEDELLFVVQPEAELELAHYLAPGVQRERVRAEDDEDDEPAPTGPPATDVPAEDPSGPPAGPQSNS
ncbi:MAG TPA: TrkA family potassium uptake protein [Propionibacterium sp.]|nr:TrkA family potassium uptake protein [Propionibacterium sp.]